MKRLLLLFFLFSIFAVIGVQANDAPEESEAPDLVSKTEGGNSETATLQTLRERFIAGILKSRSVKVERSGKEAHRKPYWFECGKRVPKEQREERAADWATAILGAIESANENFKIQLNPWGVLATVHKEGGFDMCALDRDSRIFGWHVGAVKKYKMSYSKKEIRRIIVKVQAVSKKWRFDAGPLQVRRSAEKTLEHLDAILSLDPGVQKGVDEMANRAVQFPKMRHRPWRLWPTTNPNSKASKRYDKNITDLAKFLGAEPGEI